MNLHRFRHAAASFWSIRDPVNVRGAKDLLGQASFGITEKHYIMATVAPRGPCARPRRRRSTEVTFRYRPVIPQCDCEHDAVATSVPNPPHGRGSVRLNSVRYISLTLDYVAVLQGLSLF